MSAESKKWVQSMMDPNATKQSRQDLLRKAINVQTKARIRSTIGQGCDRHLIGLYCASRELGMDVPAIFYDKVILYGTYFFTSNYLNQLISIMGFF